HGACQLVHHASDDTSRAPAVAVLPARCVPVPAQVGIVHGDDHDVAQPGDDVLVAAGAEVVLRRLIGVDPADLDLVIGRRVVRHYLGIRAHSTRSSVIATAAATRT